MEILNVSKDSVGNELNIVKGDELVSFDGNEVNDILDYEFYNSQENFVMTINHCGELTEYDIEKEVDEDLGFTLEEISIKHCHNKCKFCFVDQLPSDKDLRSTLRTKDDDYRLSFISGNYVTLTNLVESDYERIIRQKISPLYVSVHSTDTKVRNDLLGNPKAQPIMPILTRLHDNDIELHTQIVYCPGFNDDLANSIEQLSTVAVSLAIVPVGLTKNCNGDLAPVTQKIAQEVIALVHSFQTKFLAKLGTRFVFASDEFYVKASLPIPEFSEYENFAQIENGVGLFADFDDEFDYALDECSGSLGEFTLITGTSAHYFIERKAREMMAKFGGNLQVLPITNTFFGESVTVAGLVVASDIIAQASGKIVGDVIIPRCMLKEFDTVFLDNMTICDLENALGKKVRVIDTDGYSFVKKLLEFSKE